ncbi:MAG: ribosome maturation factor RimP [Caldibacillus debilis]|jgi:ribosome maturation factor RimP|uniref:Ribosome maturation factor RimP n=1 Tax=Caldibacillus debilis TaxID=301148 RepID=A0A3E0K617_9BACI|nr:ribosome maturation factor RimP [Caldibacillus debilis]MBY6271274.1 ribosome maturation factor RimP [Bacillaceae bacterium]REJ20028.1 MAG: ribosome maturation factor RimP [Caldibacillus debilis]REJ23247.1 MAG: ribosome maturation factor RimP [Caldibacillus debilis]REJ29547.1 MAG: ribosome maturation factor RimP [Caldibacillus debilis]
MSKVKEIVRGLAEPIAEEMGLELVDIEYVKEGKNWFLRIYIDKEDGVDIEECSIVSEKLSEKLDEADPIPHHYYLEVSSPGAERPLKKERDYERAVGKNVWIKTYEPIGGGRIFEGRLTGFSDRILTVEIRENGKTKTVQIPYDKIASGRLAVIF